MPRNRLPRVMKRYSPTGRRTDGRPLKRDFWIRETGTGQQVAQLYDDDDDDDKQLLSCHCAIMSKQFTSRSLQCTV